MDESHAGSGVCVSYLSSLNACRHTWLVRCYRRWRKMKRRMMVQGWRAEGRQKWDGAR